MLTFVSLFTEEKAMYSAELEKHKREKKEWRTKAENLHDQAAALQVSSNRHMNKPILSALCLAQVFMLMFYVCVCVTLDKPGWSECSSRICLSSHWPAGPQRGGDRRSEETRWDLMSPSEWLLKSELENFTRNHLNIWPWLKSLPYWLR